MMLRPGFVALSRSLQQSFATTARSSNGMMKGASTRWSSTLSSSSALRAPFLPAVRNSAIKPSQPSLTSVRGVRTSPFRPNSNANSERGLSLSLPHQSSSGPTSFSQPGGWTRALTSVGIIAGAAFAANIFLNRPTRDGPLDEFSRSYLNRTFGYLAGGLSLTAAGAVALHRTGFSYRLMATNPWLVLGVGLVASIGGMIGAQSLPPGPGKTACWLLFNASQAAVLSPLMFFNPALLARAGLYTAGVMGSICYVGATARDGQYLYLGGPLLAGVVVIALSSLAPMILPATAVRALAVTEALSLYGGLAVFGGFTLYDTQVILNHARMVQAGVKRDDPLAESIKLELDFINIFVRIVQILAMQQNRRK